MVELTQTQRLARFWSAHGRSDTHLAILHALCKNPSIAWTPGVLSSWYGLRNDRAEDTLDELAACGVADLVPGEPPAYRWNSDLDWAVPPRPAPLTSAAADRPRGANSTLRDEGPMM